MNAITLNRTSENPWADFASGSWQTEIDVRGFIQANYRPHLGDASFLTGPTPRTLGLWKKLSELLAP